ncbi:predicted protein [Histoplasma capsulatum G186AR]|uniref:Uncharacterized protein n=1 Tax=Ajellomyces capsulatus (strain G186AR / H82 / ATCC MYA-2454 / RMSCC 2432) TaxID=447093 RepID=C0NGB0_AJECG|nr:uncharacterized protein HCBG_01926 [Histoplasma capsulatum G186AR]EEH10281.1 predicted protein [Histoplasma capsulatum G186AR]
MGNSGTGIARRRGQSADPASTNTIIWALEFQGNCQVPSAADWPLAHPSQRRTASTVSSTMDLREIHDWIFMHEIPPPYQVHARFNWLALCHSVLSAEFIIDTLAVPTGWAWRQIAPADPQQTFTICLKVSGQSWERQNVHQCFSQTLKV